MTRWAVKSGVFPLVLLLAGCIHRPPNPQPTPTPAPTPTPDPSSPVARDMLLRIPDGHLQTIDAVPVQFYQAIQCCMPFSVESKMPRRPATFTVKGTPVNTRWPAASKAWQDFARAYSANAFHARLGPFYGDAQHESDFADTGGPYLTKGGEFNELFFAEIESQVAYAASNRNWYEVNMIDPWYCKHAQWGDQEMPWQQADIDACGITWTSEHERYVRAWVKRLTKYGNVIWLLDNEGNQIQGTQRGWYEHYVQVIRDEESKHPSGFVHIIGAGLFYEVADYAVTHARAPLTSPIAGRWTLNNERNPSLGVEEEAAAFKGARDRGLAWAFWRAELSDAEMRQTLSYFKAVVDGDAPVGCFPPPGDDPNWGPYGPGPSGKKAKVDAAKAVVGERCGAADKYEALDLVGAELRKQGECAGRDSDAVLLLEDDGTWSEWHIVAFTTGCWTTDPAQNPKNIHQYLGSNPEPGGCPDPLPDKTKLVWRLNCGFWCDATPVLASSCEYCTAIGMGEINGTPRCDCPARSECPGFQCESRLTCERYLIEAPAPVFRTDGTLVMDPNSAWRARQTGGSYIEVCNGPKTNCTRVSQ